MFNGDESALLLIGGIMTLVGIIAIIWDKLEKRSYLNSISGKTDIREFLEGWPVRPQFGALKLGGWIAIIVGLVLIALRFILPNWG